jgi:hypothetical protein
MAIGQKFDHLNFSTSYKEADMPKVDPETGEPQSDAPDQQSDDLRGGKVEGDASLQGASETGGANVAEETE